MSNLQDFFAQNVATDITEEFIVSERFKDKDEKAIPWRLKTISEAENEEIRKSATRMTKGKNGTRVPESDMAEYIGKLAVASVVFPDLKNAELQKSYGVIGADAVLKKMLLSGEYALLVQKVQEINGFDKDINEKIEEVKN